MARQNGVTGLVSAFFQVQANFLLAHSRIFRYIRRYDRGLHGQATLRRQTAPARPAPAPPLSFAQERLWFMEQLVPGSAAHTIPVALRLRGALDAGALELALGDVGGRHGGLR